MLIFFVNQKNIPNFALAFQKWRFRLAARTHASHAWNTGSIPVGATTSESKALHGALGAFV